MNQSYNFTINETLNNYINNNGNDIYIHDVCRNFNFELNGLILRYLYTMVIIYLLNLFFQKTESENKIYKFIEKRIFYLHDNIYFAISLILLNQILHLKYIISKQTDLIITLILLILLTILLININKEKIKDFIKWK